MRKMILLQFNRIMTCCLQITLVIGALLNSAWKAFWSHRAGKNSSIGVTTIIHRKVRQMTDLEYQYRFREIRMKLKGVYETINQKVVDFWPILGILSFVFS